MFFCFSLPCLCPNHIYSAGKTNRKWPWLVRGWISSMYFTFNVGHQGARLSCSVYMLIITATTVLTKGWATEASLQRLRHGEVAAVSEWRLHQLVLHSQVLKAIVELGIGHVDAELLQGVALLRVKVEPHLAQPIKRLGIGDLVLDQVSGHCPLVHKLTDLKTMTITLLTFLTPLKSKP